MSFNIRNIRQISTDESTKFVSHLAKKISDFANAQQTQDLENKEDIYSSGEDVDSVLRLHNLTHNKRFTFDLPYYPPSEPDQYSTLWLRGKSMGELRDITIFPQNGGIIGDPLLIDGTPFDDGIHTGDVKSTALRFNRPTSDFVNQEYIFVDNTNSHSINGITIGISYFIRFRVSSLAQQGGLDRGLFAKMDDLTSPDPTNGIMVILVPDGRISVTISRAGVKQEKVTVGTISVNTVNDVWITFNDSGDVIKVYINNVEQTLTSGGGSYGWQNTVSTNLRIFRRGFGNTNGYVEGDLYDYRIYREKVISAAEVGFMNTNKWTIADIPFGQVAITDYYSTYIENTIGYDSVGYDSTGYDTS